MNHTAVWAANAGRTTDAVPAYVGAVRFNRAELSGARRRMRGSQGPVGDGNNNRMQQPSRRNMWDRGRQWGWQGRTAGTVLQLPPLELDVDAILLAVRHLGISPESSEKKGKVGNKVQTRPIFPGEGLARENRRIRTGPWLR